MKGKTKRPLHAAQDVEVLGMFDRVSEAIKYLVFGAPVMSSAAR